MQDRTETKPSEEFANCLTHAGGLLFAVIGAAILIDAIADRSSFALKIGCWIYAGTLVTLYAVSTLSHLCVNPARKYYFRSLDQGVIFLFIAGTFTPFSVACLHDEMRWIPLAVMWIAAATGFCSKVFWRYRVESATVTHYLALGWLPVTTIEPIFASLPTEGIVLCVAGGLCYTVGTVFLIFDTKVRYFHALWHLFVITGSCCHFLVIVNYVIPLQS